jgi:hypothetical protein
MRPNYRRHFDDNGMAGHVAAPAAVGLWLVTPLAVNAGVALPPAVDIRSPGRVGCREQGRGLAVSCGSVDAFRIAPAALNAAQPRRRLGTPSWPRRLP